MAYKTDYICMNRSNTPLTPVGVVLHDTDDPGATAQNEFNWFNTGDRSASAHAFVDWVEIINTIPYTEQAWHAGPTANSHFIGVELCVPKTYDLDKFTAVWNSGVDLFSDLFIHQIKQTIITAENLMSHAEVTAKWHESTHEDPISFFVQYGKTVDEFRAAVQSRINDKIGVSAVQDKPTVDDWVQDFVGRGIIADKNQWINVAKANSNIYWLLNKSYKYIRVNGGSVKGTLTDVSAALEVLNKQGIISDIGLWNGEIGKNGNVKWLILKIADYIN